MTLPDMAERNRLVIQRRAEGASFAAIAAEFGVTRQTVAYVLRNGGDDATDARLDRMIETAERVAADRPRCIDWRKDARRGMRLLGEAVERALAKRAAQ